MQKGNLGDVLIDFCLHKGKSFLLHTSVSHLVEWELQQAA